MGGNMKKLILVIVVAFAVIAFTGMFSKGEAADIYGCAKMMNGQLRIVSSKSDCLKSEKAIVISQSDDKKYEFVGFSTAKSIGTVGILKLAQICQADFPNSRMCKSAEIIKTVHVPSATGTGWVQPTIVDSADMSGVTDVPSNLTCDGWSVGSLGLTVTTDGKFNQNACSDVLSVACCAQ